MACIINVTAKRNITKKKPALRASILAEKIEISAECKHMTFGCFCNIISLMLARLTNNKNEKFIPEVRESERKVT